ncbi:hypothetical protein DL769_010800 [Monosporascus sp. CRB-8-3]|nr:hypothetical protein DL769_010800 [Monosporascus sp. CRB-8-3]
MVRLLAIPIRSKANVVPREYQADFVKRIIAQETRVRKRPASLSIEQHAAYRKQLQCIRFIKPENDAKEVYKPVVGVNELRVTPIFNIAYDTGVFPAEAAPRPAGRLLPTDIEYWSGPAELVANQKKPKGDPQDGNLRMKAITSAGGGDEEPPDEDSKQLNELLSAETTGRGPSKALCYEDILMMIVRRPRTDRPVPMVAIEFIHHKACNKKPRPTIFYFTPTKRLIFCPVSIIALVLSLEEDVEEQLYRLFAHVSLARDHPAMGDMVPDDVWQNLPPDPEIVGLEERHARRKQGRYRVQGWDDEAEARELTEQIRTKHDQREKAAVKESREWYFYSRPTWDIERQARGKIEDEEEEYPADLADDDIFQLRVETIDLQAALWDKRETVKARPYTRAGPSSPSNDNLLSGNRFHCS